MRKILWNGSIKSELHGVLYVVLEGAPKVPHYRAFKNAQKGEEKNTFSAAFDVLLDGSIEGALGGYSECTSKDALSNLHKDVQEGACEVALQGALEFSLELHPWLQLLVYSLMDRSATERAPKYAFPSVMRTVE